jgi:hypothetical protein
MTPAKRQTLRKGLAISRVICAPSAGTASVTEPLVIDMCEQQSFDNRLFVTLRHPGRAAA